MGTSAIIDVAGTTTMFGRELASRSKRTSIRNTPTNSESPVDSSSLSPAVYLTRRGRAPDRDLRDLGAIGPLEDLAAIDLELELHRP